MRKNTINYAKNLASDIKCLLGKCKDKTQENKMNIESNKALSPKDFESKKYIDDPYFQMQMVKNSDKEIEIGENGGSAVSDKYSSILIFIKNFNKKLFV